MDTRALLRYILSPWVVGGAILLGVSLLCGLLLLLMGTRPGPEAAAPATAIVNVIPLPTATPIPPTPTPTPEGLPTSVVPPGQGSENFAVGAFVQVTGTGGDGLRLRAEPGLNGEVRFLGLESEVFQVKDGPRQVDDYTWWFLVAPYDESVQGWAVGNFLALAQNPQ
jgi:hypothetical protein